MTTRDRIFDALLQLSTFIAQFAHFLKQDTDFARKGFAEIVQVPADRETKQGFNKEYVAEGRAYFGGVPCYVCGGLFDIVADVEKQ